VLAARRDGLRLFTETMLRLLVQTIEITQRASALILPGLLLCQVDVTKCYTMTAMSRTCIQLDTNTNRYLIYVFPAFRKSPQCRYLNIFSIVPAYTLSNGRFAAFSIRPSSQIWHKGIISHAFSGSSFRQHSSLPSPITSPELPRATRTIPPLPFSIFLCAR
jgi:hypothetical protein